MCTGSPVKHFPPKSGDADGLLPVPTVRSASRDRSERGRLRRRCTCTAYAAITQRRWPFAFNFIACIYTINIWYKLSPAGAVSTTDGYYRYYYCYRGSSTYLYYSEDIVRCSRNLYIYIAAVPKWYSYITIIL